MGNSLRYWTNSPIMSFESAFNRIFQALEKDIWENDLGSFIRLGSSADKFPYCNILINKKTKDLLFQLALAGYSEDDIEITFEEDRLIVSSPGSKMYNIEEKSNVQYLMHGIKTSQFKVSFALSTAKYHTEPDKVKANFHNGILSIYVPLRESSQPKQIKISDQQQNITSFIEGKTQ